MASILTHQIISNAKDAVTAYVTTTNGLFSDLQSAVTTLTGSNFNGDASNGYSEFFQTRVTPALTENLTALTTSLTSMLDSIQEQLLDTVDPQLGDTNRNPGVEA